MSESRREPIIISLILLISLVLLGSFFILHKEGCPKGHNLIFNPGFEEGETGWEWLQWSEAWGPFEISTNRSCEGSCSALLKMSSIRENRSTVVWGVAQEVNISDKFPGCLEGYYLVEKWSRGAEKQYIQVVIIDLTKRISGCNPQIRYVLSGVNTTPLNLKNARYVFADPERRTQPIQDCWIRFSINPSKDFEENWGYIPSSGHRIRLLFEARFDGREEGDLDSAAHVYFDNLHFG